MASANSNSPEYLLILDFEATCDLEKTPSPQEIIEFPTLLYNIKERKIESIFHHYIRPDVHPEISDFCTELTGITQEQADNGISLHDALIKHVAWLEENGICLNESPPPFVYLTNGDWDLKTCLRKQLGTSIPPHFRQWINVKKEFSKLYNARCTGMTFMLDSLDLELEGRHHSGIDDTKNIARICTAMLNDGWTPIIPERNDIT